MECGSGLRESVNSHLLMNRLTYQVFKCCILSVAKISWSNEDTLSRDCAYSCRGNNGSVLPVKGQGLHSNHATQVSEYQAPQCRIQLGHKLLIWSWISFSCETVMGIPERHICEVWIWEAKIMRGQDDDSLGMKHQLLCPIAVSNPNLIYFTTNKR